MSVTLEFKPQDLWIGVFWKRGSSMYRFGDEPPTHRALDVWVCVVPMFPLHFRRAR